MSSETKNKPADSLFSRLSNKIKLSIVWKINIKLISRLLRTFLVLDLLLGLFFLSGLVIRAELTVAEAVKKLNEAGLPSSNESSWLKLTGYSITLEQDSPWGFKLPSYFQKRLPLPRTTSSGVRRFDLPETSLPFWKSLKFLTYSVTVEINRHFYRISYYPQKDFQTFITLAPLILIAEFLLLVGSIYPNTRIIRKNLRPIQELAETAQNFSAENALSPQQLKALAGKLENINATRLDTRISVSETQKELQSLAAAINGMLDRIYEAYRSQARFVSDASHELRTPISIIQGYVNLLDRWGKNDEKTLQECIDAIKEETDHMKALVEQLLFLARGDNNTIALQTELFDLADLAQEIWRETELIDSNHKYAINIIPAVVTADKGLIKQAARILIDNAIKYTPSGGKITISVSTAGDYARLTVEDEGIGIAAEDVPKIFDRFYRSDESRARATGGTGLGLAIAKWIAERHGGYIEVLSRVNIGTRISLVLPASLEVTSEEKPS